ncbi:MAG: serine/threonine protein kinase [Myxococcales bacterium]|nr:serine/threonine protein kinase [Myxococcales bacterium]
MGSKAGKYKLERLIDIGGMAAVYAASHWRKRVAIKVLHTSYMRVPEARERFAREGYAANRVEHEGVVQIIDDGQLSEGNPFIVMELLEGWSLEQRLDGESEPATDEVWWVADRVLDVLEAAHARNVVHRDLKPGNIFLTNDSEVKVLDFGLAQLRDADGKGRMTQTGTVIGTASYMPPEQALRKPDLIDARTDLWSVGAIMFRMLAGRTVHGVTATGASLIAAATKSALPIREVAPHVPEPIGSVIDRALCFRKEGRFASAAEMRAALYDACSEGRIVETFQPSTPPPSSKRRTTSGSFEAISVNYVEEPDSGSIIVTMEDDAGASSRYELRRREDSEHDLEYEAVEDSTLDEE